MTDIQVKVSGTRRVRNVVVRVLAVLIFAAAIGAILNRVSASLERSARPAGFSRGLLQGALMPMAMPNLLVGRDVSIYSANNTGLSYKLGYTSGVNGCGAIFFGVVFWRFNRWRNQTRTVVLTR
jgi:cyanate permease